MPHLEQIKKEFDKLDLQRLSWIAELLNGKTKAEVLNELYQKLSEYVEGLNTFFKPKPFSENILIYCFLYSEYCEEQHANLSDQLLDKLRKNIDKKFPEIKSLIGAWQNANIEELINMANNKENSDLIQLAANLLVVKFSLLKNNAANFYSCLITAHAIALQLKNDYVSSWCYKTVEEFAKRNKEQFFSAYYALGKLYEAASMHADEAENKLIFLNTAVSYYKISAENHSSHIHSNESELLKKDLANAANNYAMLLMDNNADDQNSKIIIENLQTAIQLGKYETGLFLGDFYSKSPEYSDLINALQGNVKQENIEITKEGNWQINFNIYKRVYQQALSANNLTVAVQAISRIEQNPTLFEKFQVEHTELITALKTKLIEAAQPQELLTALGQGFIVKFDNAVLTLMLSKDESEKITKKLVDLFPENPLILAKIAQAYFKRAINSTEEQGGFHKQACSYYEKFLGQGTKVTVSLDVIQNELEFLVDYAVNSNINAYKIKAEDFIGQLINNFHIDCPHEGTSSAQVNLSFKLMDIFSKYAHKNVDTIKTIIAYLDKSFVIINAYIIKQLQNGELEQAENICGKYELFLKETKVISPTQPDKFKSYMLAFKIALDDLRARQLCKDLISIPLSKEDILKDGMESILNKVSDTFNKYTTEEKTKKSPFVSVYLCKYLIDFYNSAKGYFQKVGVFEYTNEIRMVNQFGNIFGYEKLLTILETSCKRAPLIIGELLEADYNTENTLPIMHSYRAQYKIKGTHFSYYYFSAGWDDYSRMYTQIAKEKLLAIINSENFNHQTVQAHVYLSLLDKQLDLASNNSFSLANKIATNGLSYLAEFCLQLIEYKEFNFSNEIKWFLINKVHMTFLDYISRSKKQNHSWDINDDKELDDGFRCIITKHTELQQLVNPTIIARDEISTPDTANMALQQQVALEELKLKRIAEELRLEQLKLQCVEKQQELWTLKNTKPPKPLLPSGYASPLCVKPVSPSKTAGVANSKKPPDIFPQYRLNTFG